MGGSLKVGRFRRRSRSSTWVHRNLLITFVYFPLLHFHAFFLIPTYQLPWIQVQTTGPHKLTSWPAQKETQIPSEIWDTLVPSSLPEKFLFLPPLFFPSGNLNKCETPRKKKYMIFYILIMNEKILVLCEKWLFIISLHCKKYRKIFLLCIRKFFLNP